ncbi:MAG: tail fiber domain-containing protein [Bacteroidota bacterium]
MPSLGSDNIVIGQDALLNNVSGNDNVAIGQRAGQSNTGSGNVFLGNRAGKDESGSNKLYIANSDGVPLIYGNFSTKRIGIGTTTPERVIHIRGDGGVSDDVIIESNSDTGEGGIVFYRSKGTSTAKTSVTNPTRLGFLSFRGWDGTTMRFASQIEGYAESDFTSPSTVNGSLRFKTSLSGNLVERMRINENGNVGIGTTNPESKLNIVNGTDANAVSGGYIINGPLNATNLAIDNNEIQGRNNGVVSGIAVNFEGGSVTLGGPTNDKRFRLSPDGNVGVGTTTPDSRFVVADGNDTEDVIFSVSDNNEIFMDGNLGIINGTVDISDFVQSGTFDLYGLDVSRQGSTTASSGAAYFNEQSSGGNSSTFKTGAFAYATGNNSGTGRGLIGYSQTGNTRYGVYGNVFTGGATTSYGVFSNGNLGYMGALINTSDKKLKKNIRTFKGLDLLLKLQPKTYEYKQKEYARMNLPTTTQYGFIAQEVQEILPELVYESVNALEVIDTNDPKPSGKIEQVEYLGIDYINIIPIVTKAVQELSVENDELKGKNAALEQRLSKLEALVESLTSTTTNLNINETTVSVSDAQLFQNEPNPFSNYTKIQFFIPTKVNDASLQIIGQNGAILKRIPIKERGKGEIQLEAYTLSAGSYRYTLILDGKITDSKQMILTE